jgi:hypothetical protein
VNRLETFQTALYAAKPESSQLKQVEFIVNVVKSVSDGAFAPLTNQPAIQSLAVPLGGYLVEALSKLLA